MENPLNKLQRLYDNEINFEIDCFYDSGFNCHLGDSLNWIPDSENFETLEQGIDWLYETAKKHYPMAKI